MVYRQMLHDQDNKKMTVEVDRGKLVLYGCGDFIDDYEGIAGCGGFRDDLRRLYLASVVQDTGTLDALRMVPMQAPKMRLRHASTRDSEWLRRSLRQSAAAGWWAAYPTACSSPVWIQPARESSIPAGNVGALDEVGFLRLTGRQGELTAAASGPNVAPAVLHTGSARTRLPASSSSPATAAPISPPWRLRMPGRWITGRRSSTAACRRLSSAVVARGCR